MKDETSHEDDGDAEMHGKWDKSTFTSHLEGFLSWHEQVVRAEPRLTVSTFIERLS
jgi:hypothetical protein